VTTGDAGEGDRRQPFRLASGGEIDRNTPVAFSFDGRSYEGCAGDTLASALLANGRHLVGRSIRRHRPRGIVSAGPDEPNALVQAGSGPNTLPDRLATELDLYPGLSARSVNRWPSLELDVGASVALLGGVLSSGFYYKTFMRPRLAWRMGERILRRAAGFGVAPDGPDPDLYARRFRHCDVLIIGSGPAGLGAARAAAQTGARVLLAEADHRLGGTLRDCEAVIGGKSGAEWVAEVANDLQAAPAAEVLTGCTALGHYGHGFVTLLERSGTGGESSGKVRERLWKVRARQIVVATGAFERPLLFPGNDRPGVMLAGAVRRYLVRYGVVPGRRVLLATNNDGAYEVAFALHSRGVETAIFDSAPDGELSREARASGIETHTEAAVVATHGRRRVRWAEVLTSKGRVRAPCDVLAVSGGWNPSVHLQSHTGGRPIFDAALGSFLPAATKDGPMSAGASAGHLSLHACLRSGTEAGAAAARAAGFHVGATPVTPAFEGRDISSPPRGEARGRTGALAPSARRSVFIDFQNDTTLADLSQAVDEGFRSVEHVKRYTVLGLGTDQGKLGNVNGVLALAELTGTAAGEVGTTTFRPPFSPVSFGALAGEEVGDLYDPVRETPLQAWHREAGAVFEPVGQWMRPRFYPLSGEDMPEAVRRECWAARNQVAIFDATTLGKIDVYGAGALALLNRIYTNAWDRLAPGHCRYGLMLGEDGMVMDDGVTTCLGPGHYFMTTTTGGAGTVYQWLERWHQTEWPDLDVHITPVTEQWATIALVGPRSRSVLRALCRGERLGSSDFPFMSSRTMEVAGRSARVARISFSGELAFEIYVPAGYAREIWSAALVAGRDHEITPYGTETMHVLRAEKGYIVVGQDTDGSLTPIDLGLQGMCSKKKDFIGKRSLERSDCTRSDRKQWVGLLGVDRSRVVPEGTQLVAEPFTRLPVPMVGHITSSYWSDACGGAIALGLLTGGRGRLGEVVYAALPEGECFPLRVVGPTFFDPEGVRLHG